MYLALGIVFLIVNIGIIAAIAYIMARSNKKSGELISKKNLFFIAPSLVLIYCLYLTAAVFNGEVLTPLYCFNLISTSLDAFKFKAAVSLVSPICQAYPLFYADIMLAYLVTAATTVLSVASFFSLRIRNYFRVSRLLRRDCDVVAGDSSDAVKYLKNNRNCILLDANLSSSRYGDLLKSNVPVLRAKLSANATAKKLSRGEHDLIVFRDSNVVYTKIIDDFAQIKQQGVDALLHLEANHDEMKFIKEKFISQTDGKIGACISCFSKYELIARKFVTDHPITKYIPRSFYNGNYSLKNDKNINVVFVGFGKFNYPLFRMCATQFQFATEIKGILQPKLVNYYVLDNRETSLHNEFFSRIQYEFDVDFRQCDFEKPANICNLHTEKTDINSVEAKKLFKSLVNDDNFTYFIVSLSDDIEDASYAETIKRLLNNQTNYHIFVRARNNGGEKVKIPDEFVTYFGKEKQIYSHESIVNDDLTALAQTINLMYSNISEGGDNRELMRQKWFELPLIQQQSNLYHALNYGFKLNLLGFGMVKRADANEAITEEQFNKRYVNSGGGKGYCDYSFYFKTESSNVLAFIEHSRWNALYILNDYTQMRKADMKAVDGKVVHKNEAVKQHACLTTYQGLDGLVKFKYSLLKPNADLDKLDNNDELLKSLATIYAYDYMDLDRLYKEITALGYDIVDNLRD